MKYTIYKGKHHCSPFIFEPRLTRFPSLRTEVIFNHDIPYNLVGDPSTMEGDDFDINKLFGFGFVNLRKLPSHHWDSVRVGWCWNSAHSLIDLYAYLYIEGKRIIQFICSAELGMPVEIYITCSKESYDININNRYSAKRGTSKFTIERPVVRGICYLLDFYFGGNQKAPHNMSIFTTDIE